VGACPAVAAGAVAQTEALTLNAVFTLYNFNLEVKWRRGRAWGGRADRRQGPPRRADARPPLRPQVNEYFSPLPGATPVNANNAVNVDDFNQSDCLPRTITAFKTGTTVVGTTNPVTTYGEWLFVDPALTDSAFASACNPQATIAESLGTAPTCSTLCARRNKKCDPCAIALASCQDGLYYALGQAGVNTAQIAKKQQFIATATGQPVENQGQFAFPPVPVGPWSQTTCPSAAGGSTSSLPGQQWGPYPGVAGTYYCVNGKYTNLAGGGATGADDYQAYYGRPPNFWQPTQPNYVNPATLCETPVWKVVPTAAGPLIGAPVANLGALCYCVTP
jgi:hypothetical protein